MDVSLNCLPCIISSYLKLAQSGIISSDIQEIGARKLLEYLSQADYHQSPPAMGRDMHRLIREIIKNPDPYKEVKHKNNQEMLALYPKFQEMVKTSDHPFQTAMRLAIAGNVIDFGPQHQMDIFETIKRVLESQIAIDHSEQLEKDIEKANSILYIGDNCGEIVLDKLFIEHINHPNVTFVVRGAPTINDATMEEALAVGMDKFAQVITTEEDSPGVIWPPSSKKLLAAFEKADVIIAKGQGNLEGLFDAGISIYFMLTVKCQVIGDGIGAKQGDFIVMNKYNQKKP